MKGRTCKVLARGKMNSCLIKFVDNGQCEAIELLQDIVDSNQCEFDQHGYCQTHSWLNEGECIHGRIKKFLKKHSGIIQAEIALAEIIKHNKIENDLQSYLYDVADWGLGKLKYKPNPKDYGVGE